jgi:hypothetical protein
MDHMDHTHGPFLTHQHLYIMHHAGLPNFAQMCKFHMHLWFETFLYPLAEPVSWEGTGRDISLMLGGHWHHTGCTARWHVLVWYTAWCSAVRGFLLFILLHDDLLLMAA